jgi:hypothetical protein
MKNILEYREYMSDINKYIFKLRLHFREFIENVKNENDETKEAFDLLLKESRGQLLDINGNVRVLTPKEKQQIREQAIDVLRMVGLTSLTILPGGALVFILLKVFKLNDHILPSSFKRNKKISLE